jgi:hypothetical protein
MQCTRCGSDDTVTFETYYNASTTNSMSLSTTSGVSIDFGKLPSFSRSRTRGRATTQPLLTQRTAPPRLAFTYDQFAKAVILLVFLAAAFCFYIGLRDKAFSVGIVAITLPIGALLYVAQDRIEQRHFGDYMEYRKWWICRRCSEEMREAD